MLTAFSAFALLLASLGIYAVISYTVGQRMQEIGIRMALGMQSSSLERNILGQTLRLASIGIAAGVCVSLLVSGALSALLFGVKATDPLTFVAMLLVLTAVALATGYLPARRASRINPISALRAE